MSSVQLALTSPLNDPSSKLSRVLFMIDIATSILFAIEAVLKIMAFGFMFSGENSYLRNPWNVLDFIIMILSVLSISPIATKLNYFKMFRIFRILRLFGKNEGLRIGLQALLGAMPNVLRISVIMLLFFLVFGVICVSYFKGKFHYCMTSGASGGVSNFNQVFHINHKWDCLNAGAEWYNKYYNFDNIFNSMVTFFILCNISGW